MITLFIALYKEAKPFLERFSLKRNTSEALLTLYENEQLRVVITGVGPIAACMSAARYFALFPQKNTDLIANVGLAGLICPSCTKDRIPLGTAFLAMKLVEDSTGRTFYPDLLYQNSFPKAQLITGSAVVRQPSDLLSVTARQPEQYDEGPETLVDMEASSIYQAALAHCSVDRMFFFKIVSDYIACHEAADVEHSQPEALVSPYADRIFCFLSKVQQQLFELPESKTMPFSLKEQECIQSMFSVLPMTVSMQERLLHCLRYAKLCKRDLVPLISTFLSHLPKTLPHGKKQIMPYLNAFMSQLSFDTALPISCCPSSATGTRQATIAMEESLYLPYFSHIYIEAELWEKRNDLIPSKLVSRQKYPPVCIPIAHYKDVFNRSRQRMALQKHAPALIFANNHGTLLYPGAPVCQSFGNKHFYYTSNVMNCIYHCDYCYLQGMYPSGHLVVFVNLDDYFAQVEELLKQHPVYLCISYDTDLPALEPLLPITQRWVRFAAGHPSLTLEIRTKSGNPELFSSLKTAFEDEQRRILSSSAGDSSSMASMQNLVFAWTVSPEEITHTAEHGAAPLFLRKKALKAARAAGFSVRLCFDPMIYHSNWQDSYRALVSTLFEQDEEALSSKDLWDVSIGVFRISTEYLKAMRKQRPDSALVQFPYISENGVSHYGSLSKSMVSYLKQLLQSHLPEEQIFVWDGSME